MYGNEENARGKSFVTEKKGNEKFSNRFHTVQQLLRETSRSCNGKRNYLRQRLKLSYVKNLPR